MGKIGSTRTIGTTIFRTRKARLARTHFVEIVGADFTFRRLGPFETRPQAEDWIRTKSARWLADQMGVSERLLEQPLEQTSAEPRG